MRWPESRWPLDRACRHGRLSAHQRCAAPPPRLAWRSCPWVCRARPSREPDYPSCAFPLFVCFFFIAGLCRDVARHALGLEDVFDLLGLSEGLILDEAQFGREFHGDQMSHFATQETLMAVQRRHDLFGILAAQRLAINGGIAHV